MSICKNTAISRITNHQQRDSSKSLEAKQWRRLGSGRQEVVGVVPASGSFCRRTWGSVIVGILFLHGWHSVPGGVKPTFLAQHGHEVINPALPDEDFEAAVRIAQAEFDQHQPEVVVGSSRGGAVAMNIDSGEAKLVLMCPAWKNWGTAKTVRPGTRILHSGADDVIPFADSEEMVRNSGLPASTLIEVGCDHWLADPESLEKMLRACEGPQQR
jgi:hypothetical protein